MRQSAEGIILRLTLFLLALRLSLQQRAGRSDPTTGCLSFDNQHSFIQHCSSADDCTSEDEFCPCCREYGRRSDWAQACIAFCGERVFAPPARDRHIGTGLATAGTTLAETDSWRIDDFGKSDLPQTERSERGPYFEQPALSLVGDAAVVLGDCYNLDIRSTQVLDRAGSSLGTRACLLPPVSPKLFDSDAGLRLNLSVCPSSVAPLHIHDPQPAALAAMLCFDECHVRNLTTRQPEPPVVDHDALFIANCTRRCFASCVRPIASSCCQGCHRSNYSCFGECHLRAETCSVFMGQRDTRSYRTDPNSVSCYHYYQGYEDCGSALWNATRRFDRRSGRCLTTLMIGTIKHATRRCSKAPRKQVSALHCAMRTARRTATRR